MKFTVRVLAGILVASLLAIPGWTQGKGRDPLTDAEVDQMREAADFPNKRLDLLVKFARERVFEIESAQSESAGTAKTKTIHDTLQDFIFILDDEFDIDGDVKWNPARFLNHSCEPNARAEIFGEQIWILARRDIAPGEEVTFNYSYGLEDYEDHPCKCGAVKCVGYIIAEEYFPKIKRKRPKAAKTAKV